MKFIILSSSRGTTMQAVLDDLELKEQCLGLVSDREDRGCVEKAKAAGIPVKIVKRKDGEDREQYDKRIDAALEELGADEATYIAALGWMFILSPWFVAKWPRKIINVHPSLLPKYPGAHAIRDALADDATETGMTIHYIDEGVDTGEIIEQQSCTVDPDNDEETLKAKIQELEKEWYPRVLKKL